MSAWIWIILLFVLFILTAVLAVYYTKIQKNNDEENSKEIAYTELIKEISNGNIEKMEAQTRSPKQKLWKNKGT